MKEDCNLKDYYFSMKSAMAEDKLRKFKLRYGHNISVNFFKGRRFTECCDHGQKPMCKFNDLRLLGSGYNNVDVARDLQEVSYNSPILTESESIASCLYLLAAGMGVTPEDLFASMQHKASGI